MTTIWIAKNSKKIIIWKFLCTWYTFLKTVFFHVINFMMHIKIKINLRKCLCFAYIVINVAKYIVCNFEIYYILCTIMNCMHLFFKVYLSVYCTIISITNYAYKKFLYFERFSRKIRLECYIMYLKIYFI